MGGYLATLLATRLPVDALVLMAPAVDLAARWREKVGEVELERWEREGSVEVDHLALKRRVPIGWGLMADAPLHEPWPAVRCPTIAFQGTKDEIVLPAKVKHWASLQPQVKLVMVDDSHELRASAERIVRESMEFLATIPALVRAHPGLAYGAGGGGAF